MKGIRIFFIVSVFCLAAFGQEAARQSWQTRDHVPANITAVQQPDSPLQFRFIGMRSLGILRVIEFEVKNVGPRGVRAFVIAGFPRPARQPDMPFILQQALQPGASRTFSVHNENELKSASIAASVDLVVFSDQNSWGADTKGESVFLQGFYEGQRDVVSETRSLLAGSDDAAVIVRFKRQPFFPNTPYLESKPMRWRQGYNSAVGSLAFPAFTEVDRPEWRKKILSMADDIERSMGHRETPAKNLKKISTTHAFQLPPITVLELKRGREKIALEELFEADKDWLSGLSIKFRNGSGRTIKFFLIEIDFPETAASGTPMRFTTDYGCRSIDLPCTRLADPLIPPGGEFEIAMDGIRYSRMQRFLGSRHQVDDLTRANLSFSMYFTDGTAWSLGPMVQDPENPRRFNPVKQN